MMQRDTPTDRTQLRRFPARGVFDREQVNAILDEGWVCHVGFTVDSQPYVIPTGYARVADQIYIHGSAVSRMLRSLTQEIDVCITVTLLDALVLARSAFHHSMNYRSVVILGKARHVTDATEKLAALRAFTNHVIPGRWEEVRPPDQQELDATSVLALPLEEVSAKVRTGQPKDDVADYALPVWAGTVPLHLEYGDPVSDGRVAEGVVPFDPQRLLLRAIKPR